MLPSTLCGIPLNLLLLVLQVSLLGLVFYLDLLAPEVLLDGLGILDDLLADTDLLLEHRSLLDHHLFLDHGHHYLVFPDLWPVALPLDRDALDRYFHTL